MTEEEARTKRCCGPEGCGNSDANGRRRCIASDCAAWRYSSPLHDWVMQFRMHALDNQWVPAFKTYRAGTGATLNEARAFCDGVRDGILPMPGGMTEMSGYCGLAGKP